MNVSATTEEKVYAVYLALTTGLPYFSGYGFILDYSETEYDKAKQVLKDSYKKGILTDTICIEDVQAQMLHMGYSLNFIDGENDDEVTKLTLSLIESNWDKVPANIAILFDKDDGDYDADDADSLMQYLLFGEIVYG